MNIIFNQQIAEDLKEKYIILELDTVKQPDMSEPLILHALIEIENIKDIMSISFLKDMHAEFINEYKVGNWNRAIELIGGLKGQFNGELDSFYENVLDFCNECAIVNKSWDGIRHVIPQE